MLRALSKSVVSETEDRNCGQWRLLTTKMPTGLPPQWQIAVGALNTVAIILLSPLAPNFTTAVANTGPRPW